MAETRAAIDKQQAIVNELVKKPKTNAGQKKKLGVACVKLAKLTADLPAQQEKMLEEER